MKLETNGKWNEEMHANCIDEIVFLVSPLKCKPQRTRQLLTLTDNHIKKKKKVGQTGMILNVCFRIMPNDMPPYSSAS